MSEVSPSELDEVMRHYFVAMFPNPSDRARWIRPRTEFVDAAPQRFYRVRPTELYILDDTSLKIDRRLRVDIGLVNTLHDEAVPHTTT